MKDILKKWDYMLLIPYLGLFLVIVIFGLTSNGKLFQAYNIRIIIQQTVALGIVCLGAIFVYSLGSLDISIGAVIGLCTLVQISIVNFNGSLFLGFLAALIVALSFGLFNSAISTWLGLPAIVTSLFLMFIGSGIQTLILLKTNTITSSYDFSLWKNIYVQITILATICGVIYYLFYYTRFGKYTSSIGSNIEFARQSGVNVVRYKIYAYLIMGFCIAVASVFVLSRSGSASRVTGSGFHMDVMVALILGGMPLSGGMKSRVSAALVGAFTYTLLTNGLTISGVGVSIVPLIKAMLFALVVIITSRKKEGVLPR